MKKFLIFLALIMLSCNQSDKGNSNISSNKDISNSKTNGFNVEIFNGFIKIGDVEVRSSTNFEKIKEIFGINYTEDEVPGYRIIQYLEKGISFNFSTEDLAFKGCSFNFSNNLFNATKLVNLKIHNIVLNKSSNLELVRQDLIEKSFEDISMNEGSKRIIFKQTNDRFDIYISFKENGLISQIEYLDVESRT